MYVYVGLKICTIVSVILEAGIEETYHLSWRKALDSKLLSL